VLDHVPDQVALVSVRLVTGLAVMALVFRGGGLVVGRVVVVLVPLQQLYKTRHDNDTR